ncbi:mitochondrial import receptor subunit TOM20 homolog [Exaiptasia diaphana]|uniref:Mitochondrial import receptor subunit TOM20 n=1 Tax=Exaiptasia diaphana TaxID=2652724 RepID=A0A913XT04_EXADI|nr:mitochondrial import receptor subunit TOM20 homolog [Exaiptasia diaphana]KXJ24774.1 Mitochondrial import receptor subunit TOM20-like [Exaiptasia diaphana]
MSSKSIAAVVAGVCGTIFLGYCIYFDRKRRSDPLYKQKILERRRKAKEAKQTENLHDLKSRIPNTSDPAAIQKFFLEEVQLGEDALTQGDYESTVKHLTNAITVCGQPQQLLQLFQTTLPEHVFKMLLDNIQGMKKKTEEGESLD